MPDNTQPMSFQAGLDRIA